MNMQKIFDKSENQAVAVMMVLFVVAHFGVLYLIQTV